MTATPFTGTAPGGKTIIPPHPKHGKEEVAYPYLDADGKPLFYVCRYRVGDGKTFLQGRPNGARGWVWNLRGITPVLYRLPELRAFLEANDKHAPLYIIEGEKAVDYVNAYLRDHGLPGFATCNPMGAGKWKDHYSETLHGARYVVLVADQDEAGLKGMRAVADQLAPYVGKLESFRPALEVPHAGFDDHLEAGLDHDALVPLDELIEATPAELEAGPLLMSVRDFAALQDTPPEALWGTEDTMLIAEGLLAIGAGRPGVGKTTLVVDLAFHLAAGIPWPPPSDTSVRPPEPWPVARPLRIALLENEGPIALFRDKIKRKLAVFPHDIEKAGGYLGVQTWRWGNFSFADDDAFTKAAVELEELGIDLVIGDPLNMLGVEGVGSPADTRDFIQRLRMLGLGTSRAFLLLHHFRERVESSEDELRKLSGAWGGHLDTLITLAQGSAASELRLAYPKLRWALGEMPKPVTLGKVYNIAGFEALGLEDDVAVFEPKLVEALRSARESGDGYGGLGWFTATKLAAKIQKGRTDVEKALNGAEHLFVMIEGERVKELGAKKNTKLWGLRDWQDDGGDTVAQAQLDAQPDGHPGEDLAWR